MMEPDEELLEYARRAATAAYADYSGFRVGAAVRVNKTIYTGCNVENASYGLTVCAERVAIFAAVAAGARRIDAIAVACIDAASDGPEGSLMPCGACRQVISEFGADDLPVHVDRAGSFALASLLPRAFLLARK
jgi:cytidine deaminase